jgi:hypothetical protein
MRRERRSVDARDAAAAGEILLARSTSSGVERRED